VRAWRIGLGVVGVLGIVAGVVLVVPEVSRPSRAIGLLVWLAVAVLLHDAVLAPIVVAASIVARRAGRRVGWGAVAIVQVGVVAGLVVTLVALPAIRKQALGVRNPTVLPQDYVVNLGLVWAAVAVAVILALAVYVVRGCRAGRAGRTGQAIRSTSSARS